MVWQLAHFCKPCLNEKWPLRKQLVMSFLSLLAVIVVLAIAVDLSTTAFIGQKVKAETRKNVERQIERHLTDASVQSAATIGEKFRRLQYGVLDMSAFAFRDALQNDLILSGGGKGYPLAPAHADLRDIEITESPEANLVYSWKQEGVLVDLGHGVWHYNNGTSVAATISAADRSKIDNSARMDLLWPTMYAISNATLVIYATFPLDFSNHAAFRRFPGRALSSEAGSLFACDSSIVDGCYDPTARPWYEDAVSPDITISPTTLLGDVALSKPYITASGTGSWLVTLARAVYGNTESTFGQRLGVVGVDVALGELQTSIEGINFLKTGYSLLATADSGTILAAPDEIWNRKKENKTTKVCELEEGICGDWSDLLKITDDGMTHKITTNPTDGRKREDLILIAKPVNVTFDVETGKATDIHFIVSVVPVDEIFEPVDDMEGRIQQSTMQIIITTGLVAVATLVAVGIAVYVLAGNITRPIAKMADTARSIARDGQNTTVFGGVVANWGGGESSSASTNGSHKRARVTDYLLCKGADELDTLRREFGLMITGLGKRGKAATSIGLEDDVAYAENPFVLNNGIAQPTAPHLHAAM